MPSHAAVVVRLVPLVMVMGTIFFLSHQTGDSEAFSLPAGVDKVAHMVAYGTLAASFIFAMVGSVGCRGAKKPWKVIFFTLLFCFFYGLSDEFHQSFIPGRFVSGFDLLADFMGAAVVSACWLKYRRSRSV